jgi:6,7-dimethyl-8-ribityllumazine synthase
MACRILARSGDVDAIVATGVVIRGETTHYEIVSEGAASGIQAVQLETGIPIAFGVLTVETVEQALERSQGEGQHNVGEEAAAVAVEMARLVEQYD